MSAANRPTGQLDASILVSDDSTGLTTTWQEWWCNTHRLSERCLDALSFTLDQGGIGRYKSARITVAS